MPGGMTSKRRGNSYEYRVRDFMRSLGWDAERNPLSGASAQISQATGKHDVRASNHGIFLQMECKKTKARDEHKLRREWFEKIDFTNDEFLVFAFGRSPNYAIIPESIYRSLNEDHVPKGPRYVAAGSTQFAFKRQWLEEEEVVVYLWETYGETFVAATLEHLIDLIERRGPLAVLKPMDFINSAVTAGELVNWYKQHRHRLTNLEKCHYYGKLHRLEYGISDEVSPEYKASVQWWRDTSDDVVMKCPYCSELITYKQLKENRDKGS